MSNVAIQTSSIPVGFCFTNWQESWPTLVALLSGNLADIGNFVNIGNAIPSLANQDKPWIRSNSDGSIDKTYTFTSGVWVAKHPAAEGTVILYNGSEASIDAFDGGETAVLTWNTGPMWKRIPEMAARFPLEPGTLPSATVIAVAGVGGQEKVTLDLKEIPSHNHTPTSADVGKFINVANAHPDQSINRTGSLDYKLADLAPAGGDPANANATQPHDNIPPYYGIFFLKKTSRTHYRL